MTPDPYQASGGVANPGSWNRYSYVVGDPVNNFDPAGLQYVNTAGGCSSAQQMAQQVGAPGTNLFCPTGMYGPGPSVVDLYNASGEAVGMPAGYGAVPTVSSGITEGEMIYVGYVAQAYAPAGPIEQATAAVAWFKSQYPQFTITWADVTVDGLTYLGTPQISVDMSRICGDFYCRSDGQPDASRPYWNVGGLEEDYVAETVMASAASTAITLGDAAVSRAQRYGFRVGFHGAHHYFPEYGERLPHIQVNWWEKGVKGSGRVYRRPLRWFGDSR